MSNPGPSNDGPQHQSSIQQQPHLTSSKQLNSSSAARSRVTLVCSECKRLKLRCDRRLPCNQCTKRSTLKRCVYAPGASEKIDVQSLHNRTLMLENWKESTQMLIAALEARLPPLALVPPPSPTIYTATGMSARPTPLDEFTLAWLAALKVPTTSLRPLESRSSPAIAKFVKLVKSKKVLAEAAGAWDRAFLPPEYAFAATATTGVSMGLGNNFNSINTAYPFQTPKITSLMLTLLPPATTQSVVLLPALQNLLILHPICHFQRFQARCRLLETYQPDGQPWAAQLAARMDQEGPEAVYKDEEEPTLAMYAATMAGLAVGALAHRAELRAKGLPIPSSTPSSANVHGNGFVNGHDGHHAHHHPGIAPGNTPGITDADPTRMFVVSLRALEKSSYLECTRAMEEAQPSLGTDKVLAGLFQVLFLLFCGELEDNAEGVLDGVREERLGELLARVMAGVRVAADAVGLLSDPDEVTARRGQQGMTLWQKEERRRLAAAVVYYDAIVNEILGQAPTLQDVNYTARAPAEVDDRAFSPDTTSVEKVPPVGENAGFCSTFFAMRTRLMRLIKYGDQVVLYARRKDERDRMMSTVESFTTRLAQMQVQAQVPSEDGEEPQLLHSHLHSHTHLHTHHQAQCGSQGRSSSDSRPSSDGVAAPPSLDFDLPTSSQLVARHASSQRTVLKDWLAGLPGYMTLDESKMFAEEVARTHGGVSAITGEKAAKGRMSKNGEACLRHPEMIAQQCELVVMAQSAVLKWHLPLLKRETKTWDEHDPDWEPTSEAIWTSLEAAKKLVNALNVQQHVIKAKMPLVISSQAFLRNVFHAGIAFGRLAYLATAVPYRQLDDDEDLENDERDVPEWGASVAQGAKEGLAKCVRIYADVEKWMRGIDRKAPVAPSFPKSSPLRMLETLLWKVESGFAGDLHTVGTKRKRYDFEEAELIAQGLLVPYLESYGGVWVIDPRLPDSDETENETIASSSMEIVGQDADYPPPPKRFKKGESRVSVHSTSELVEVTTPERERERERERGKHGPGHRPPTGAVFTVRKRDKHVAGEVKVEGAAPIGWQRHHQEIAEVPPDIIRGPEDPVQNPTVYVPPTPQGPQTVAPASKYYGHASAPASARPQHVPPKMQPQLRVDTAGLRPVNTSIAPSPVTHYIPHSGISAPSASAETWSYQTSQYGLPTPQQAQQYSTPNHYETPAAVQAFNPSYVVQHPGMQSQQHSPDNYPPVPPESQMHPHHHTPEHPVVFEDPQYAASGAHATPAPIQMQTSVYQAGQTATGVSPQPAIVYQYTPQPVNGTSMTPQAHHAHAQGSAPRGTGYGLGMSGYPTQPRLQSDVQPIPPQVQTYTPTAQGSWDRSGQDHLAAYSSGFVQSMNTPMPMPPHSSFDQDLQVQPPMEVPFTIPSQAWDPTTSSTAYPPAPNGYTSARSY